MSQLSEEPQRIPHLEHGEQLQLDGKRHVGGTCAVHGVTCALHEHRHPAPHAQRIRVALPGRPHVGIAIGLPAAHVRSSLSVNNSNLQHMWHLSVSRIYQARGDPLGSLQHMRQFLSIYYTKQEVLASQRIVPCSFTVMTRNTNKHTVSLLAAIKKVAIFFICDFEHRPAISQAGRSIRIAQRTNTPR